MVSSIAVVACGIVTVSIDGDMVDPEVVVVVVVVVGMGARFALIQSKYEVTRVNTDG